MSTLEPAGPAAQAIGDLWWALLIGAALITLLVAGLLALAWWRHRHEQAVSHRLWIIGGGLAFPLVTLATLTGFAFFVGERLLPHPDTPNLVTVEARGHQWWWEFVHRGPDGQPLYTSTELHIPAGRPVDVRITSGDVIHSFWVPQLAGKLDAIPGHVNVLRLEAERPGRYRGRCAEFCGIGHAHNAFTVIAHAPADYVRWLALTTKSTPPPNAAFTRRCGACHATDPRVRSPAPHLGGIGGREWPSGHELAGLDVEAMRAWLRGHADLKSLGEAEIDAILAYLGAAE